jgi:L,D-peptidoglycan transpeptidase YkuD (ErfK/YbiS/YcfS/YnhG family)
MADTSGMARRALRSLTVLVALLPLLAVAAPAEATVTPSRLRGVGSARQVIAVTNNSWSSTYATFQAFEKRSDGSWRRVYGPWTARVGRNGFGANKREGDGQTPYGSYPITKTFGVRANPGVRVPWFRVGSYDVWVDDSYSSYYNTHARVPANGRWRSAESLYQPTAYAYAAFIAYNVPPRPGYGSAIFLHVSTGRATAGCVSLPMSQVVPVLRWMDPAKGIRIVMGPESAVTY